MKYLNLDLLFERQGEQYKAWIINSPGGQASTIFRTPFQESELEKFFLQFKIDQKTQSHPTNSVLLKIFGKRLFETVFDQTMQECLRSSLDEAQDAGKGLRIRLRLTNVPELANLPWEYLYHSNLNYFFSRSVETPIVRYSELPGRIRPLSIKSPLRILFFMACPHDYPQIHAEEEWHQLKNALNPLEQDNLVIIEREENATLSSLHRQLQHHEYHIFHFVGHGDFDKNSQNGVLIFEDENEQGVAVSGERIGTLLKDHATLRLAILNSCDGTQSSQHDRFAQSLVQQGIPAVIAMQFKLTDQAAITLSYEFYSGLAKGLPVDTALAETRKVIYVNGNETEWGTPVLYMRSPDGAIFNITKTEKQKFISTQSLEKSQPNNRIKQFRIAVLAIFLITTFITALLHWLKVDSTLVELQLTVNEFSFTLKEDWLFFSLVTDNIKMSHLENLTINVLSVEQAMSFHPETDQPQNWREIEFAEQLGIERTTDNWNAAIVSSYLNLTDLSITAGSHIRMVLNNSATKLMNLQISNGSVNGTMNTADTLLLTCSNCRFNNEATSSNVSSYSLKIIPFDNQITFKDLQKSLQLEVSFPETELTVDPVSLAQNMSIQAIDFTRLTHDKRETTITKPGAIFFTDFNNKKLDIDEGDFITLEPLQNFRIKKMHVTDNIVLTLQGRTSKLVAGAGESFKSRMPSRLEWLYANQFIMFVLATIIPAVSVIVAILHRLIFFIR